MSSRCVRSVLRIPGSSLPVSPSSTILCRVAEWHCGRANSTELFGSVSWQCPGSCLQSWALRGDMQMQRWILRWPNNVGLDQVRSVIVLHGILCLWSMRAGKLPTWLLSRQLHFMYICIYIIFSRSASICELTRGLSGFGAGAARFLRKEEARGSIPLIYTFFFCWKAFFICVLLHPLLQMPDRADFMVFSFLSLGYTQKWARGIIIPRTSKCGISWRWNCLMIYSFMVQWRKRRGGYREIRVIQV